MAMSTNQITVTGSATLIKSANSSRKKIVLQNLSDSTIYLGDDSSVTTSNGYPILSGDTFQDMSSTSAYYGIVASGSKVICFIEEE